MLPQPGVSETATRFPVDIRRFPWIRRLAADYAFAYDRVSEFFAGNPAESSAWKNAIARTQRHPRQREAIAAVLEAQQRDRGAPPAALAATARLRDPQSVAVVTGQQAGLFGGPLFTLLKAITALQLAERVTAEHHVPAVAVFWIDAEDHDWDEVRHCGLLDSDLASRSVALGELPGTGEQPVARVTLDGSVDETLTTLEALLPPTEFTADVVSALRRSYQPGAGMADAFARWMESVLGPRGLVVFDSSDSASKPLLADVFAREIEQRSTSSLAARAGSALEALGYHAQATPADATLALFHQNDGRHPIRLDAGGGYLIDGRRVSQAELLADVRSRPDAFSPGVLLRPIAQDTLFPTVCYVSGPSELAYLGQLKEVYASFGVPMPLVQQRATATVVDGNAMRFFRRQGVQLERLRAQDESALNDLLGSQLPPGIDASLERTGRAVEAEMQALAESVAALDPTLEGAARSTLSRMQDDLKRLHAKILQAAKRKDDTLRRQFHHARAQAFPAGQPQERQLAGVYFLDRYGPALLDRLLDILPGEPGMHYLITV